MQNRTPLPSLSAWRQLKEDIFTRDLRTCDSCGYIDDFAEPSVHKMRISHRDNDASNYDPLNLYAQCLLCKTIRYCDVNGILGYLTLRVSDLPQKVIVQRSRESFEVWQTIPVVEDIDPASSMPDIDISHFAQKLHQTALEDLPADEQRYKVFFTQRALKLFLGTNASDRYHSNSAIRAQQIRDMESAIPSIFYSREDHQTLDKYLQAWRPSKTGLSKCVFIYVVNHRIAYAPASTAAVAGLQSAWEDLCAQGRASASELHRLAQQFGLLSGKWLLSVTHDQVDRTWDRIARATNAGTLGTQARVTPFDESYGPGNHQIAVFTKDFTDTRDLHRVRDSLRRLGSKCNLGYKPEAYTYCGIYGNNPWNIKPTIFSK